MQQLEIFEIQSPCIGVCQTDRNGNCLGCYRTRDERLYWLQCTPDVKRKIVKACALRKRRATQGKRSVDDSADSPQQQSLWDEP